MLPLATALRALMVLLLAVSGGLPGCSDEEPVPFGERPVVAEPDSPSVASAVADPTAPRIVSIVVSGASLTGDTGVVELEQNVPVRLVVISDRADTVVVRGYGISALAVAEVPVQLDFLASRTGEFAVVLEDTGLELTRLRVG